MNIGRYQIIFWRRWSWIRPHRVVNAPLGYIYDFLGMIGPVEIRRFKAGLTKPQS